MCRLWLGSHPAVYIHQLCHFFDPPPLFSAPLKLRKTAKGTMLYSHACNLQQYTGCSRALWQKMTKMYLCLSDLPRISPWTPKSLDLGIEWPLHRSCLAADQIWCWPLLERIYSAHCFIHRLASLTVVFPRKMAAASPGYAADGDLLPQSQAQVPAQR